MVSNVRAVINIFIFYTINWLVPVMSSAQLLLLLILVINLASLGV